MNTSWTIDLNQAIAELQHNEPQLVDERPNAKAAAPPTVPISILKAASSAPTKPMSFHKTKKWAKHSLRKNYDFCDADVLLNRPGSSYPLQILANKCPGTLMYKAQCERFWETTTTTVGSTTTTTPEMVDAKLKEIVETTWNAKGRFWYFDDGAQQTSPHQVDDDEEEEEYNERRHHQRMFDVYWNKLRILDNVEALHFIRNVLIQGPPPASTKKASAKKKVAGPFKKFKHGKKKKKTAHKKAAPAAKKTAGVRKAFPTHSAKTRGSKKQFTARTWVVPEKKPLYSGPC